MKNMKSNILISLILLFFISCKEKKVRPMELANQILKKYEGYQSLSYDINYKSKYYLFRLLQIFQIIKNLFILKKQLLKLLGGRRK